jgi:hypothetical protein
MGLLYLYFYINYESHRTRWLLQSGLYELIIFCALNAKVLYHNFTYGSNPPNKTERIQEYTNLNNKINKKQDYL